MTLASALNFFCALTLLCSTGVVLSSNPLHSALFLVSTFLFSSVTVLLLESEFLALFLLLIYLGAVMVLFLFVIMMLDLKPKVSPLVRDNFWVLLLAVAGNFALIRYLPSSFDFIFYSHYGSSKNVVYVDWYSLLDVSTDVSIFSQAFYSNYTVQLLTAGLLLYVSVIGVVYLTSSNSTKNAFSRFRTPSRQLSRKSLL